VSFVQDFIPICSTSGRGHLIFGDARGFLKIINRDLEEEEVRFQAYETACMHLQQLKKSNILVTIGSDGGINNTTIKIWRLDKTDAEGNPMLARALKVFSVSGRQTYCSLATHASRDAAAAHTFSLSGFACCFLCSDKKQPKFPAMPVTSFTVLEDLSQLALGLGNGAVMLFDGNLLRDRNVKQSLIQGQGKTVVRVQFREPVGAATAPNGAAPSPAASSSSSHPLSESISRRARRGCLVKIVDTVAVVTTNSEMGCWTPLEEDDEELMGTCMNDEKRLVVATRDAVFFYEAEEKREAYGFEGHKKIAMWFNGYLVLVCENSKNIDAGGRGRGCRRQLQHHHLRHQEQVQCLHPQDGEHLPARVRVLLPLRRHGRPQALPAHGARSQLKDGEAVQDEPIPDQHQPREQLQHGSKLRHGHLPAIR